MSNNEHKSIVVKIKNLLSASFRNGGHASHDGNTDKINHGIEQYKSIVNDPNSSEEAKKHAREELEKLGIKE